MNIFLTIVPSLFWLIISYYVYQQYHKKGFGNTFIVLYGYRLLFFCIQFLAFEYIYHNQIDSIAYQKKLDVLFVDCIHTPFDSVHFLLSDYDQMQIPETLTKYFELQPRVAFFLKVLLPFYFISAGNAIICGLWLTLFGTFCFMSFLSVTKKQPYYIVWFLVLLVPSISFWTVGMIKEAFVIPVFFLLYYFFKKTEEKQFKDIYSVLFFLLFIYLAWNIKYYYTAIFLLAGIAYILMNNKRKISVYSLITSFVLVLIFLFVIGLLHPNLIVGKIPEAIYQSYQLTCTLPSSSDCVYFSLDGSWMSIIKNIPKASLQVFYSPTFLQIHNISSILAAIESLVLLLVFIYVTYKWILSKTVINSRHFIWLICILFTGVLLIMASPNIGSFNRYRIIYLPVFCYILFVNIELPKWIYSAFLKYIKKK